jgi:transcriptional regulator with XRE-family HTH domain
MESSKVKRKISFEFQSTVRALKAARILKNLSRNEAATKTGWSTRAIEQMENGRCNFTEERLQKVLTAYGYSDEQFKQIQKSPKLALAKSYEQGRTDRTVSRKPRRNHYKIVTKVVRAIRILRRRKGLSQYAASRLCGYVPASFGHLEVGRINITDEKINHILTCLGYLRADFDKLMSCEILPDELVEEAVSILQRLDQVALESALTVLKALLK